MHPLQSTAFLSQEAKKLSQKKIFTLIPPLTVGRVLCRPACPPTPDPAAASTQRWDHRCVAVFIASIPSQAASGCPSPQSSDSGHTAQLLTTVVHVPNSTVLFYSETHPSALFLLCDVEMTAGLERVARSVALSPSIISWALLGR